MVKYFSHSQNCVSQSNHVICFMLIDEDFCTASSCLKQPSLNARQLGILKVGI